MKTKKGLELRQLSSKSFILEATTEYKESFNKMVTFNSTAAFLWDSIKDKDFSKNDLCKLLQDKFSFSKEIIGGYILFPGRMNEQQMLAKIQNKEGHLPYYLQSIAEVNIGAYPLLPNEESGLLLENHLRRVLLDESILQQLEVSVPQRGLVYTDDPELALSKKWNRTKVLVFVDVIESHWKKIDNQSFDSVSVGIEMDLHAFGVVKDFTKAKYVVITNAGKDDKFKYRLYKIKGEPKLVYEIDTETCISTTYTNPKPDVTYLDKEGKPIKHKIVQSAYIQYIIDNPENSLQMPRLSRDKIESTKKEGEDRHRPRIAKMSEIME